MVARVVPLLATNVSLVVPRRTVSRLGTAGGEGGLETSALAVGVTGATSPPVHPVIARTRTAAAAPAIASVGREPRITRIRRGIAISAIVAQRSSSGRHDS